MKSLPKLAHKLVWGTAALVVGSGLMLASALGYLREQAHQDSNQSNVAVARIVQEQTDRTLENVDQHLELIAARLAGMGTRDALDPKAAENLLAAEVRKLPFVRAIWVMDSKGILLYDSDRSYAGANLSERAYFQIYLQQPETGFHLGAPLKSKLSKKWVISASRPIRNTNGAFAGIVVASLEPSYFDELWSELDMGPDGSISLFRRDAVLMTRSPFVEEFMGKTIPETTLFRLLAENKPTGTFETTSKIDQVQRDFAYRSLQNYPAVVVVGRSHTTTFATWLHMAALSSGVWFASSAFIALLLTFLVRDLVRREAMEHALRVSQAKQRAMLDALPDLMFEVGLDGRYHDYHSPRADLLAAPPSLFMGKRVEDILPPYAAKATMAAIQEGHQQGYATGYQISLTLPQGERWFELSSARKAPLPGEDARCIVLSRDITQRKLAEQELLVSLQDKVGLLNEVHHRVKNNLQVITSLLRLEANRSALPETKTVMADMQGRIRSMALLHESLYRTGTFASVELGAYLKQLCTQAFRSNAQQSNSVQLVLDLAEVHVSLDQATPCGLLVNELLSNCLKHGFPNGRTGEVHVGLKPLDDNLWCLSVSDNGVGLSADFDTRRATSLGLQLVSDLARQLAATIETGHGPGAHFKIVFPIKMTSSPREI